MSSYDVCGVHLYDYPVERCALCERALEELRSAPLPDGYRRSAAQHTERAAEGRARGHQKQRKAALGFHSSNHLSVAKQKAWHQEDAAAAVRAKTWGTKHTWGDRSLTLTEWSREPEAASLGITMDDLSRRLCQGWTIERAVTSPLGRRRKQW